ncbi:MAG: hypothetical protein L0211_02235 [Planctomycetaceae bacterium]|nr:hypothetical protein [Planctomycetaceae bacterium]
MAKKSAARKIEEHLQARERGKTHYALADKLLDELITELKPGTEIELSDGRVARLVDNFADGKNKHFKPTGVARFEIGLSRK